MAGLGTGMASPASLLQWLGSGVCSSVDSPSLRPHLSTGSHVQPTCLYKRMAELSLRVPQFLYF